MSDMFVFPFRLPNMGQLFFLFVLFCFKLVLSLTADKTLGIQNVSNKKNGKGSDFLQILGGTSAKSARMGQAR